MKRQLIYFIMVCAILNGCSYSSKVLPMGPDTYTVSTSSEFGSLNAKKRALKEANEFAASKEKYMILV